MVTRKPSKQRKNVHQAPLHRKQKLVSAHLSKPLIKQMGKRSLTVRTGDEVKVVRGKHKGKVDKISRVELKRSRVFLETLRRKKVSGEEVSIPINPSNLIIITPVLDDAKRKKIIDRKSKEKV
jgi:large subunit ribosomal protein L24